MPDPTSAQTPPASTVPTQTPAGNAGADAAPTIEQFGGAMSVSKVTLADLKAARRAAPAAGKPPAAAAQAVPGKEGAPPAPGSGGSTSSSTANSDPGTNGTPAPSAGAEDKSKQGGATIDMEPAELAHFTSLNREVRRAREALKEAEAKLSGFGRFEKAAKLAQEGKHYDAAREAGIDVDAALAELLGQQQGTPGDTEVAKLRKDVEDLRKAREEEARAKADEAKRQADAEQNQGRARVIEAVQKAADKYPYLAKSPDLIKSALADADAAYEKVKAEFGGVVSDADKNRILMTALDVHEEKWATTFGPPKERKNDPQTPGFSGDLRGGVKETAVAPPKRMTFEEVRARRARELLQK